ncbi:hypothetical protein NS220_08405 [Microbacterium testaceum]|uniref:Uncharacterized protein n=1 Tax=Microbacterium testaceum TaxID=2033 RepID=A0A147EXP9_MICTE|nr:hypothetical protein [Microbacterium testaceum]KTR94673.1 hypothetical protein NS220_08405 [Microbacterium testaceum]
MTALVIIGLFAFAGVCVWVMVSMLNRFPMVGLYLMGGFVIIAWDLPDSPALVSAFGVQVKFEDAICLALMASALSSVRVLGVNISRLWWAFAIFLLAVSLSLGFGILANGLQAVNEARATLWLVIGVTWVLSRDWSAHFPSIRRFFLHIGLALTAVAALHLAIYGWGGADSFVTTATGVLQTGRPLVSGQAAVLLCCGLAMILTGGALRVVELLTGFGFIAVAILCMHRSVWVAAFAGLLVAAMSLRGRALIATIYVAFYSAVILACAITSGVLSALGEIVGHALSSDGTLNAREGSWSELIDQSIQGGIGRIFFGASFGAGWGRVVDGAFVDFNPHNWYVVLYLRVGLLGLAAAVFILAIAAFRLFGRSSAMLAVLLAIGAYAWFYHLPWYTTPWLGVCLYVAYGSAAVSAGSWLNISKDSLSRMVLGKNTLKA